MGNRGFAKKTAGGTRRNWDCCKKDISLRSKKGGLGTSRKWSGEKTSESRREKGNVADCGLTRIHASNRGAEEPVFRKEEIDYGARWGGGGNRDAKRFANCLGKNLGNRVWSHTEPRRYKMGKIVWERQKRGAPLLTKEEQELITTMQKKRATPGPRGETVIS